MSRSDAAQPTLDVDALSDAELQQVLQAATRAFARRFEAGEIKSAFANAAAVTATEVAITASAMLRAVNMQVFELGLWQSWNNGALYATQPDQPTGSR
jgi:hypothetical protein